MSEQQSCSPDSEDIVPRLRHLAKLLGFDLMATLNEAADEIEHLRGVAQRQQVNNQLHIDLGIVLAAFRDHENATGESYDDEDGCIKQIEADYEARDVALSAVPPSPVAGEVQDWITYADRLEKVLEVVAGSSTDALKRSQAQEGLRLVRPSPVSSTTSRGFYGAECPSYPNCSGGCGLGCTKKIESARAASSVPSTHSEGGK